MIDWEYSGCRFVGYDALVFYLNSRLPKGLSQRLDKFIEKGFEEHPAEGLPCLEDLDWSQYPDRRSITGLFLLEELLLQLRENFNPQFFHLGVGEGLILLSDEIKKYTEKDGWTQQGHWKCAADAGSPQ